MAGGTGRNPHVFSILDPPGPDPESGEAVRRECGEAASPPSRMGTAPLPAPTLPLCLGDSFGG